MALTLQQLARRLHLDLHGDPQQRISGVASLERAGAEDLCFILHRRYLPALAASACAAVIIPAEIAADVDGRPCLVSANPQYHFVAAINALGLDEPAAFATVHPSALVSGEAEIGDQVAIGAHSVIEAGAVVGAGSSIGAGVVLEPGVNIGAGSRLHSRVIIRRGSVIGQRCIIHPGAVIGADGFGLVMHEQRWHKIPQLGGVIIGDDVEIGANTTIDRGALDDTLIGEGCKLDNLIQVGHNVRVGAHTAIAACVGIAGSAVIGRYCKISGAAVVLGHLEIADHVTITAMSMVTRDITGPGTYSSGTPLMDNRAWHRSNARYKTLDAIARRLESLEKLKHSDPASPDE